ncbi:MAG: hypothetical protein IBJ10_07930 [Phycisphaerales bacterium]|nr:hypothetical protein [Phycisphaerales bacterium]
MRIDPGAVSAAITGPVKQAQADPSQHAQRAVIAKKKAARLDAAELGKAALTPAQPVDLGRTPAAARAQLQQAVAQGPTYPAHNVDSPRPAADPTTTPAADSRMAQFLASYGAAKGDSRYNDKFDLDGDGVIGFSDLNALLSQPAEPATPQRVFGASDLDGLLQAFNSRLGDSGFNPEYDLNQDGVIDFTDLNNMVNNMAPEAAAQSPAAAELTGLLGAFNKRTGQEGFDARFDYDNDGVVSFMDLNKLLDELTGS